MSERHVDQPAKDGQRPAVQLDHVSKAFGSRKVLDDLSLDIHPGEGFCLLGRSGIGKSVTLRLMIRLIEPDRGTVSIEGTKLQGLPSAQLGEIRKKVGFLFQNAALFDSISVADNIAFPLRRHTKKSEKEIQAIVQQKLSEVELQNEGKKMPAELSGGMSKRAGLARALALDPNILLVDEPSSGLDHITAEEIYDLLLRLKMQRHATLVVVTHDVKGALKFADRFAVLDKGKIAACGTAEELANNPNPLVQELTAGSET